MNLEELKQENEAPQWLDDAARNTLHSKSALQFNDSIF